MTQRKEELSTTLPSVKPNNCWWSDEVLQPAEPNTTQSYRDFVLISEFSELEGPLPLAVVANSSYIDLKHYTEKQCPNNPHLKELSKIGLDSFDFNAFVLRVVSVDRNQDLIEPLTPSSVLADSPPNTFSIPDDTQVYFTDSEHKFFAFTHHLTLFDINARGYVHPVALSYITRDPDKIVIRFEELMEQFNQVSVKMKKGNYSNFTLDLKCRLIDLEFTESAVSQQQKPTLSLQAIKQAITATKLMIDTLESSITQMNNTSLKGSKPILSSYTTVPKDYQPKCIDTLYPVPHFERKLRSLAQLCQEPDEEESQSSLAQKTATMIPLLSIIESQQQQQQTEERSTFSNAITHDMYSEAIKSIQDMTCYLGKSSMVLDVDDEEELFINPISSALTFGRTFMLNMDNPQPREEEKEETSDESAMPTLPNETSLETEKEEIRNLSSSQDTDDDEFYFPVLQAPLQLWKPDPAPTHLLQVLRKYQSLIVDVIFSLLTGRTVLIQGSVSNKHNVQQVVHALAVFVPGQSRDRHQIIDWFETSRFTDSHIGSIKLVGIAKENMDASIHIEGSCVLDIDAKNGSLNSSPVYVEGQWINQLLDRMMLFSSDESYLAYLHTVFMTMSLKAFVYHHLYVCDEFKLDETASDTAVVSKGYTSEASESSTLSRKWSIRLLNYLKKQEDPETDLSSRSSSAATASVHDSTTTDDEDYSEENQATVTLQNLLQKNNQQDKPRTIVGLFSATGMDEPVITNATASTTTHTIDQDLRRNSISTTYTRESSISSGSSPNLSDDEGYDLRRPPTTDRSFLNFGAEDLEYFGQAHESDEDDSSSEEEKPKSRPARRHGSKHRLRKLSDVGPDGVSYTERRGRRYLQEKMKYLATCVL
ncbi:hypothetical protein INT48_009125 [Thamnidium elegans]|uniref:UDENN FLCN/SMCR8-type domain-containing protein n=1 Tax=Thamnidium elegans TaxID=101142 RepID=A0A8H7SWE9_9FUNG|nr:hypothetical protein INT48_009125 [Thamnidium elegans]